MGLFRNGCVLPATVFTKGFIKDISQLLVYLRDVGAEGYKVFFSLYFLNNDSVL